jgi:hypothetical protein
MHLHPSCRHAGNEKLALHTDLRQMAQAVVAGAVTIGVSSHGFCWSTTFSENRKSTFPSHALQA